VPLKTSILAMNPAKWLLDGYIHYNTNALNSFGAFFARRSPDNVAVQG